MRDDPWLAADLADLSRAWREPLARWIASRWGAADGPIRLVDLGCGDLQLATLLPARFHIDGVDPSPAARAAAQATLAGDGRTGRVVASLDELEARSYDGAVLASVSQYLAGPDELRDVLGRLAGMLAPGSHGVIITDLVPWDRSRVHDAWVTWRFLRAHAGLRRAMVVLARSARRSPGRLTTYSSAELRTAADAAGLVITDVTTNLSFLDSRRSVHARPVPTP